MAEPLSNVTPRKEKIAIIGAGPCGLSAALFLEQKGYKVTIYEREKKPGGILTTLIPRFRLPDEMLKSEINAALKKNFELKCGVEVGKDIQMETLLANYDAIFVAIGAWRATSLGIPGEEKALSGFDILRKIKAGETCKLGHVGVIGGGNTAIDAARSLLRQGNDVEVFYRRRVMDMPAEHEDRIEAQEEGIEIVPLTTPIQIKEDSVVMIRTECKEGRKGKVTKLKGTEHDIKLDAIVITAGQEPESSFLEKYVQTDNRGRILVKNSRTSHRKIFAGGDAVCGSATVAYAVGQGLEAAEHIDVYLRRVPFWFHKLLKKEFLPKVMLLPMKDTARIEIPHRKVEERVKDFDEVELKASDHDLRNESCRCLTCPLKYSP